METLKDSMFVHDVLWSKIQQGWLLADLVCIIEAYVLETSIDKLFPQVWNDILTPLNIPSIEYMDLLQWDVLPLFSREFIKDILANTNSWNFHPCSRIGKKYLSKPSLVLHEVNEKHVSFSVRICKTSANKARVFYRFEKWNCSSLSRVRKYAMVVFS